MPLISDDFADAIVLSGTLPVTRTGDSNLGATIESGEPTLINYGEINPVDEYDGIGATIWYEWTCSASGVYRIRIDTDFDSVLSVYIGSGVSALTRVAQSEIGWYEPYSEQLYFDAVAGTTYRIQVGGYDGLTGNIDLELDSGTRPPNDAFVSAITLSGEEGTTPAGTNIGASVEAGEPRLIDGGYYGMDKTVWYTVSAAANDLATVLVASDAYLSVAVYEGSTLNNLALLANGYANNTVTVPASPSPRDLFIQIGGLNEGDFEIQALVFAPHFPYDAAEFVLSGGTATITADNTGAIRHTGEGGLLHPLWFKWTPSGDGEATIAATGTGSILTRLFRYDGALALTELNSAYYGLGFAYEAGETYYFQISQNEESLISVSLTVTPTPPDPDEVWSIAEFGPVGEYPNLGVPNFCLWKYAAGAWVLVDAVRGAPLAATDGERPQGWNPHRPVILTATNGSGPWTRHDLFNDGSEKYARGLGRSDTHWCLLTGSYYITTPTMLHYWTDDPDALSSRTITLPNNSPAPTALATDGGRWAIITRDGYIYANNSANPESGTFTQQSSLVSKITGPTLEASSAFRACHLTYAEGKWVATVYSTWKAAFNNTINAFIFFTATSPTGPWTEAAFYPSIYYPGDGRFQLVYNGYGYVLYSAYQTTLMKQLQGATRFGFGINDAIALGADGLAVMRGYDNAFNLVVLGDYDNTPTGQEAYEAPSLAPFYNDLSAVTSDLRPNMIAYDNGEWIAARFGGYAYETGDPSIDDYIVIWSRGDDEAGSWGVSLA